MLFREVSPPAGTSGSLFFHSMLGRCENFEEACKEIASRQITRVVSLAALEEIKCKSPEYAKAIDESVLSWKLDMFPVRDFGVPDDREGFWSLALNVADGLRAGESILVHCGAGIGRTGMFGICVLMALRMPREKAVEAIKAAGSCPEKICQWELIEAFAKED